MRKLALAAVVSFLTLPVAHAAPSDPYDAAHDAESRLDYRQVITFAQKALEQKQTHDRLIEVYRMLGTAQAVLGHDDQAVDAFTKLLAIDPDHRLSRGVSPKIQKPFKEAGGYWIDRPGGLGIKPDVPREMSPGKALTITVKLDDPLQMAASVRMNWRHEGDTEFQPMEQQVSGGLSLAVPTGGISFTIPGDQIQPRAADYNLEFFFVALSANGSELRLAGDPLHPLFTTVRALRDLGIVTTTDNNGNQVVTTGPVKKKQPAYLKKWWFWTAVGGGVVVAAVLGGTLGWYYGRDTSHVDINVTSK